MNLEELYKTVRRTMHDIDIVNRKCMAQEYKLFKLKEDYAQLENCILCNKYFHLVRIGKEAINQHDWTQNEFAREQLHTKSFY